MKSIDSDLKILSKNKNKLKVVKIGKKCCKFAVIKWLYFFFAIKRDKPQFLIPFIACHFSQRPPH